MAKLAELIFAWTFILLVILMVGCEENGSQLDQDEDVSVGRLSDVMAFWTGQTETSRYIVAYVTTDNRVAIAQLDKEDSSALHQAYGSEEIPGILDADGLIHEDEFCIIWSGVGGWGVEVFSLWNLPALKPNLRPYGEFREERSVGLSPHIIGTDEGVVMLVIERFLPDEGRRSYRMHSSLWRDGVIDKFSQPFDSSDFKAGVLNGNLVLGRLVKELGEIEFLQIDWMGKRFKSSSIPDLVVSDELDSDGFFWEIVDSSDGIRVIIWKKNEGVSLYKLNDKHAWVYTDTIKDSDCFQEVCDVYYGEKAGFILYRSFGGLLGSRAWSIFLAEVDTEGVIEKRWNLTERFQSIPPMIQIVGIKNGQAKLAYAQALEGMNEYELRIASLRLGTVDENGTLQNGKRPGESVRDAP